MRLYDLTEQYNMLLEMLDENPDSTELKAMVDGIEGKFDEKCESIIKLMQSKQAEFNAMKAEVDRLQKRMKATAKSADWLWDYVEQEMKEANKTEIKSALFKIKLQMSPPSTIVDDESLIPVKYKRHIPASSAPDKPAIKEAIQRGEDVPGARIHQELRLAVR